MMKYKIFILTSLLIITSQVLFAQGVAINTDGSNADASAMLDVKASDKGLLIPRISIQNLSEAAPVTSPAISLLVYNTNSSTGEGYYYWTGSEWMRLTIAGDLSTDGLITCGTENYIIKSDGTNGVCSQIFDNGTNVGIGGTDPPGKLSVRDNSDTFTAVFLNDNSTQYDATAIYANCSNSDANGIGIMGEGGWMGIMGTASLSGSGQRVGVWGYVNTSAGNKFGVRGEVVGTGTNYGIYGTASGGTTNWAGYFAGDAYINNNLGIGTETPAAQLHTTNTVRFEHYTSGVNGALLTTDNNGDIAITDFTGNANHVLLGNNTFGNAVTSATAWQLTGNTGTTAGTNFLGTTDAQDLVIKTNAVERMRINGEVDGYEGFVGINNSAPLQPLDVKGDVHIGGSTSNYDGQSEFMKIWAQGGHYWTLGAINTGTQATTDLFIGHNDDGTDGIFHVEYDGNIGIGTTTPASKLEVQGSSTQYMRVYDAGNAQTLDVLHPTTADGDFAIQGTANNSGAFGILGYRSATYGGIGVYGNTGISGDYAVLGRYDGNKYGYLGSATYGAFATSNTSHGGYFTSTETYTNNYGVYGECASTDHYGYGGYFVGGYRGVYGKVSPTGSSFYYGVYGYVSGGSGTNYGIRGYTYGSGTNYGVYGYAGGGTKNWAGYFSGNTKTTGYLLVGNPDEPTGVEVNDVSFYHINFGSTQWWNYVLLTCNNTDGALWSVQTDHIKFDNTGTTEHYRAIHSPYIWFPGIMNTSATRVEIDHDCALENGYDGVYLEWDYDNNGTYTKITSWSSNGYTAGVDGCDQTCGQPNTDAWTSVSFAGQQTSVSNALSNVPQSSWVRFRLVGMENNSTGTGDYRAYEFWVKGNAINFGSSGFEPGGIYAEGHVFAQSNSQIGDVAEFFPVQGSSAPGDLISMDKTGSELTYITSKKMDPLVIGVHSSSPSVLVNNPENGIPVGLSGRVQVNVTNENGNIMPGDYLTSSSKKGFAMKATENCFIVGRAMEKLNGENGKILCMINPGWYNPNPKSEGVISGNYSLIPGQNTVKVIDERVHEGSRVFVTMRDDPGSYFWVKSVKNGFFEISVKNAPQKPVPFDYLINNASTVKEIQKTIHEKLITDEKKINQTISDNKPCKNCESKMVYIGPDKDKIDMSKIAISSNPPSPPPDINKAWTWDPVNGFKELNVEFNKIMDKKQEKNNSQNTRTEIEQHNKTHTETKNKQ